MTITFDAFETLLQTNWGWATGLAASMLALTLLAGGLLNPGRKDDIALWLMGAQSEETWARTFATLFDAIIWLAFLAYLGGPPHEGGIESFAEILGLISIFSVLFYSTFPTSVRTWAYILSTRLARAFTRLRLAHWLDVENKPVRILGGVPDVR